MNRRLNSKRQLAHRLFQEIFFFSVWKLKEFTYGVLDAFEKKAFYKTYPLK